MKKGTLIIKNKKKDEQPPAPAPAPVAAAAPTKGIWAKGVPGVGQTYSTPSLAAAPPLTALVGVSSTSQATTSTNKKPAAAATTPPSSLGSKAGTPASLAAAATAKQTIPSTPIAASKPPTTTTSTAATPSKTTAAATAASTSSSSPSATAVTVVPGLHPFYTYNRERGRSSKVRSRLPHHFDTDAEHNFYVRNLTNLASLYPSGISAKSIAEIVPSVEKTQKTHKSGAVTLPPRSSLNLGELLSTVLPAVDSEEACDRFLVAFLQEACSQFPRNASTAAGPSTTTPSAPAIAHFVECRERLLYNLKVPYAIHADFPKSPKFMARIAMMMNRHFRGFVDPIFVAVYGSVNSAVRDCEVLATREEDVGAHPPALLSSDNLKKKWWMISYLSELNKFGMGLDRLIAMTQLSQRVVDIMALAAEYLEDEDFELPPPKKPSQSMQIINFLARLIIQIVKELGPFILRDWVNLMEANPRYRLSKILNELDESVRWTEYDIPLEEDEEEEVSNNKKGNNSNSKKGSAAAAKKREEEKVASPYPEMIRLRVLQAIDQMIAVIDKKDPPPEFPTTLLYPEEVYNLINGITTADGGKEEVNNNKSNTNKNNSKQQAPPAAAKDANKTFANSNNNNNKAAAPIAPAPAASTPTHDDDEDEEYYEEEEWYEEEGELEGGYEEEEYAEEEYPEYEDEEEVAATAAAPPPADSDSDEDAFNAPSALDEKFDVDIEQVLKGLDVFNTQQNNNGVGVGGIVHGDPAVAVVSGGGASTSAGGGGGGGFEREYSSWSVNASGVIGGGINSTSAPSTAITSPTGKLPMAMMGPKAVDNTHNNSSSSAAVVGGGVGIGIAGSLRPVGVDSDDEHHIHHGGGNGPATFPLVNNHSNNHNFSLRDEFLSTLAPNTTIYYMSKKILDSLVIANQSNFPALENSILSHLGDLKKEKGDELAKAFFQLAEVVIAEEEEFGTYGTSEVLLRALVSLVGRLSGRLTLKEGIRNVAKSYYDTIDAATTATANNGTGGSGSAVPSRNFRIFIFSAHLFVADLLNEKLITALQYALLWGRGDRTQLAVELTNIETFYEVIRISGPRISAKSRTTYDNSFLDFFKNVVDTYPRSGQMSLVARECIDLIRGGYKCSGNKSEFVPSVIVTPGPAVPQTSAVVIGSPTAPSTASFSVSAGPALGCIGGVGVGGAASSYANSLSGPTASGNNSHMQSATGMMMTGVNNALIGGVGVGTTTTAAEDLLYDDDREAQELLRMLTTRAADSLIDEPRQTILTATAVAFTPKSVAADPHHRGVPPPMYPASPPPPYSPPLQAPPPLVAGGGSAMPSLMQAYGANGASPQSSPPLKSSMAPTPAGHHPQPTPPYSAAIGAIGGAVGGSSMPRNNSNHNFGSNNHNQLNMMNASGASPALGSAMTPMGPAYMPPSTATLMSLPPASSGASPPSIMGGGGNSPFNTSNGVITAAMTAAATTSLISSALNPGNVPASGVTPAGAAVASSATTTRPLLASYIQNVTSTTTTPFEQILRWLLFQHLTPSTIGDVVRTVRRLIGLTIHVAMAVEKDPARSPIPPAHSAVKEFVKRTAAAPTSPLSVSASSASSAGEYVVKYPKLEPRDLNKGLLEASMFTSASQAHKEKYGALRADAIDADDIDENVLSDEDASPVESVRKKMRFLAAIAWHFVATNGLRSDVEKKNAAAASSNNSSNGGFPSAPLKNNGGGGGPTGMLSAVLAHIGAVFCDPSEAQYDNLKLIAKVLRVLAQLPILAPHSLETSTVSSSPLMGKHIAAGVVTSLRFVLRSELTALSLAHHAERQRCAIREEKEWEQFMIARVIGRVKSKKLLLAAGMGGDDAYISSTASSADAFALAATDVDMQSVHTRLRYFSELARVGIVTFEEVITLLQEITLYYPNVTMDGASCIEVKGVDHEARQRIRERCASSNDSGDDDDEDDDDDDDFVGSNPSLNAVASSTSDAANAAWVSTRDVGRLSTAAVTSSGAQLFNYFVANSSRSDFHRVRFVCSILETLMPAVVIGNHTQTQRSEVTAATTGVFGGKTFPPSSAAKKKDSNGSKNAVADQITLSPSNIQSLERVLSRVFLLIHSKSTDEKKSFGGRGGHDDSHDDKDDFGGDDDDDFNQLISRQTTNSTTTIGGSALGIESTGVKLPFDLEAKLADVLRTTSAALYQLPPQLKNVKGKLQSAFFPRSTAEAIRRFDSLDESPWVAAREALSYAANLSSSSVGAVASNVASGGAAGGRNASLPAAVVAALSPTNVILYHESLAFSQYCDDLVATANFNTNDDDENNENANNSPYPIAPKDDLADVLAMLDGRGKNSNNTNGNGNDENTTTTGTNNEDTAASSSKKKKNKTASQKEKDETAAFAALEASAANGGGSGGASSTLTAKSLLLGKKGGGQKVVLKKGAIAAAAAATAAAEAEAAAAAAKKAEEEAAEAEAILAAVIAEEEAEKQKAIAAATAAANAAAAATATTKGGKKAAATAKKGAAAAAVKPEPAALSAAAVAAATPAGTYNDGGVSMSIVSPADGSKLKLKKKGAAAAANTPSAASKAAGHVTSNPSTPVAPSAAKNEFPTAAAAAAPAASSSVAAKKPTAATAPTSWAAAAAAPSPTGQAEAEALKVRGNESYVKGDFKGAADLYTAAIRIDGTQAVYYGNRAAAHIAAAKYRKGYEDALKAMAMDGEKTAKYAYRCMQALYHLGKHCELLSVYERAMYRSDVKISAEDEQKSFGPLVEKTTAESCLGSNGGKFAGNPTMIMRKMNSLITNARALHSATAHQFALAEIQAAYAAAHEVILSASDASSASGQQYTLSDTQHEAIDDICHKACRELVAYPLKPNALTTTAPQAPNVDPFGPRMNVLMALMNRRLESDHSVVGARLRNCEALFCAATNTKTIGTPMEVVRAYQALLECSKVLKDFPRSALPHVFLIKYMMALRIYDGAVEAALVIVLAAAADAEEEDRSKVIDVEALLKANALFLECARRSVDFPGIHCYTQMRSGAASPPPGTVRVRASFPAVAHPLRGTRYDIGNKNRRSIELEDLCDEDLELAGSMVKLAHEWYRGDDEADDMTVIRFRAQLYCSLAKQ